MSSSQDGNNVASNHPDALENTESLGLDEAKLASIQSRIVAKQFDEALNDLENILHQEPNNVDALYMSAVCLRYLKEFNAALEITARLKTLAPENGRAYQEEGHAYRDSGNPSYALKAYSAASRYNPALVSSWREQIRILNVQARYQDAAKVKVQLDYIERLPKPLLAVMDLTSQGKLLKAEGLCRRFLLKRPHHVEAMRLLAVIGLQFGVLEDAEFLLESAHMLDPKNTRVHIDYIQALRKRQQFVKALEQATKLLETSPNNPQFQSIFAIECMQVGDYERALNSFDKVLMTIPADPVTLTSKGHAYKTRGHYDEAVDSYRAALTSQSQYGEAWYSLANLKVYSFDDIELRRMQVELENEDLKHADRVYLNFALGKAWEDRSEFQASFLCYQQGNSLKKQLSRYDAEKMTSELLAQQRVCTSDTLSRGARVGHPANDPIFVVGLPRSGSTLLEQILSSHSKIDGTLELPNIPSLAQQLRRRGRNGNERDYPANLLALSDQELETYGRQYMNDTYIHRGNAPFFVDKMPNNFRHIGLIHLILPNAKIIDARRHPMACGFSGYKQLFAEGQEFTYDLVDIGRYYRDYVELMDHWHEVLPGKILRVQYEDVVGDLDTQVRRILDYCGLEFERACLNFHRTDRAVRTPSSEQVRQPIFKSGMDYWRNYEQWLEPLKVALGKSITKQFNM